MTKACCKADIPSTAPDASAICRVLREADMPIPSAQALDNLAVYLTLLMKWNKAMNLVGARNWQTALTDLVADSLFLDNFLNGLKLPPVPEIWDLGAGAGLPGIPLRILNQTGVYRMVEAREKRSLFLGNVLARLKLPRTFCHQSRAEQFFASPPGAPSADVVISRAFMPWVDVLAFVQAHLSANGLVIILANGPELDEAPPGWTEADHLVYTLPGGARRFQAFTPAS